MKPLIVHSLIFLSLLNLSCFQKRETVKSDEDYKPSTLQKPAFYLSFPTDTIPLGTELLEGFIHNNTSMDFTFGADYSLDYHEDSVWRSVVHPEGLAFNSMAYALPANDSISFKVSFFSDELKYEPGKYRVRKTVSTQFVQDFYVVDSLYSATDAWKDDPIVEKEYELMLQFDTLVVGVDSVSFTIKNNSNVEVFPLEFYILQYYDEENDRWLDYYYHSYKPGYIGVIKPGQSMDCTIHLNTKQPYRFSKEKELYLNKYFLRPGKYRLYKDIDIVLNKEFYLLP